MDRDIIAVENLLKTFKIKQKQPGFLAGFKSVLRPHYKEVEAVKDISFRVRQGEVIAFIGPNGAGKSTTIKMLTGILYPTAGFISVLGFTPATQRQKLAYHIGSVFGQKPQLWYHLPAQDTFNLLAKIYELRDDAFQERLKFLVEAFEIGEYLETPVRKLSLGQRMRCEIAASLLHRPKIIFLDEPTIGLDVVAKQHIREVIKYLNEKEQVTIFLTSHDAGDVETLSQRTVVINYGTIVYDGSTEQFKKDFIKTKTVEIVTEEPITEFNPGFGKIVEQSKYTLKIELAAGKDSLDKLLNYTVGKYRVQDMNISDPEMEEIIAGIYRQQKN